MVLDITITTSNWCVCPISMVCARNNCGIFLSWRCLKENKMNEILIFGLGLLCGMVLYAILLTIYCNLRIGKDDNEWKK